MFWNKKEKNVREDMQSENIYLVEQINELDWTSLKSFDMFFDVFLEAANQMPTLKPILDKMVANGFKIQEANKHMNRRKSLRSRIVGDKDVEALKEDFKLRVEELNELTIDIEYYKDKYKRTKKRPYSEQEFKEKVTRQKKLEDFVLENSWISDHQLA